VAEAAKNIKRKNLLARRPFGTNAQKRRIYSTDPTTRKCAFSDFTVLKAEFCYEQVWGKHRQ